MIRSLPFELLLDLTLFEVSQDGIFVAVSIIGIAIELNTQKENLLNQGNYNKLKEIINQKIRVEKR